MTTTVEVLATAFKDAGTPFIVGHPGGESVELMEAARQRQMRFLLMKQEVAGAMLASTWGLAARMPNDERCAGVLERRCEHFHGRGHRRASPVCC